MALTRWAHLLALMTVFGSAAFLWLLERRTLAQPPPSRLWLVLAGVAAGSALLQFVLTVAGMSDAVTGVFTSGTAATVLEDTLFGQVFIVRVVLLAALIALIVFRSSALLFVAIVSGAALAAVALTSHAAASGREAYALWRAANDAVHLLCGGFWIGGLAMLLKLAWERTPFLHATVVQFSESAIYVVTFLALAGMINTGFIFAAQRVSWFYVTLLLLKVAAAVGMIVLAFVNRVRIMPALAEGRDADVFARNVRAELLLGAGVVALAAVLGSVSPG
ncbi:MAG TPA: CopD family protein [Rhizomicrobium sp.]